METCVFGFDRRAVDEASFLKALSRVAHDFDEEPKELICALAPLDGDTQWFTFRATPWAPHASLAADFFGEVMLTELDFVSYQCWEKYVDDVMTYCAGGTIVLALRSNGWEVAVFNTVSASVRRRGDTAEFMFAALGWNTRLPRDFTAKCRRIALRKNGKIVDKLAVEPGGKALPPIRTVRSASDSWFGDAAKNALERFVPYPARTIDIKRSGDVPDFTGDDVISGRIMALPGANVAVVDLNALRTMIAPATIDMRGAKVLVARKLEQAGDIYADGCERIELPLLRKLEAGDFSVADHLDTLELPNLIECGKLTIAITYERPFTIRLPKLARGKVVLYVMSEGGGDLKPSSVLDIPSKRVQVEWSCDDPLPKRLAKWLRQR